MKKSISMNTPQSITGLREANSPWERGTEDRLQDASEDTQLLKERRGGRSYLVGD